MNPDDLLKLLYSGNTNDVIDEIKKDVTNTKTYIKEFAHNGTKGKGVFIIHIASALSYLDVVKFLIEKMKMDVDTKSEQQFSHCIL